MDGLVFGIRLDTYRFTDGELTRTVEQLLADNALRERLAGAGRDRAVPSQRPGQRRVRAARQAWSARHVTATWSTVGFLLMPS
ncbi:hypothetical protein NRF20_42640 [Streptomyces sp. R-74717]|uniref:hypothetical protein n=1 Tax=Streptomyces TaxID=1883 RepID=UPI0037A03616